MDYHRLIDSLAGQIEADIVLGARWLPISPLAPQAAAAAPRPGFRRAGSDSPACPAAKAQAVPDRPEPSDDEMKNKKERLDEINRAVARCRKCGLHPLRTNVVPGQGNPNARIVFVGEAPGESEDQQGLAFVGRAGKLLTSIIEAMGLTRDDVYICNILKCRPPENRDPQAAEIVSCIDYLHQQLDIINPEIIVALGAHAARTLLDNPAPIGQLRGKMHQYLPHALAQPIKLVATYHPAYLLRSYTPENRQRVWTDMQMVLKELGLPIPKKSSGVGR